MSLKSIGHFQRSIYEMLKADEDLKTMVSGIYLTVQQDAKYPFILVSLLELKDVSKYTKTIYEIEFAIALFTRDKVQEPILKIADHISGIMDLNPIGLANANVISMRKYSVEWIRGHDMTSGKVLLKYKGIIGS